MAAFQLLAILVMAGIATAAATDCQGDNWKEKTLEQRASVPQWVAYVEVVSNEVQARGGTSNGTNFNYEVRVNVVCWLKRGPEEPDSNDDAPQTGDAGTNDGADSDHGNHGGSSGDTDMDIDKNSTLPGQNITILIEKVVCKSQTLEKGKKYILFLEKTMEMNTSMIMIVNVNAQPGAISEPTNKNFEAVHRGIDAGMKGEPDGECLDGIKIPCFVGDVDEKVCNQGVSVKTTMASMIMATVLAVTLF